MNLVLADPERLQSSAATAPLKGLPLTRLDLNSLHDARLDAADRHEAYQPGLATTVPCGT